MEETCRLASNLSNEQQTRSGPPAWGLKPPYYKNAMVHRASDLSNYQILKKDSVACSHSLVS